MFSATAVPFRTVLCAALIVLAAGCATTAGTTGGSNAGSARAALNALKADKALAGFAPAAAMQEAEDAVRRAESCASDDESECEHLGYLAEVRVEIARADAEKAQALGRTEALTAEREQQQAAAEQARLEAEKRATEEAMRAEMEELKFKQADRGFVLTLGGGALFSSGKWDVKPGAQKNLDRLAEFLVKHPEIQVSVEGHSDSQGNDEYNLDLSRRRAEAVMTYLVGHGVAAERVTAVGKGETLPVADNTTAEGRQHNRRVEIVIAS